MKNFFWVTEGANMISQSFIAENLSLSSLNAFNRNVVAVRGMPTINTGSLTFIFL
jgi:hypothetical protein